MERPQGSDTWVSGESGPTPSLHSTPRTPADEKSAGFATLNCGYAVQSEAWQRACLHTNRLRCCSACRPVDAGTCSLLRTPLHTELAAYLSHLVTHTSASTQRHAGDGYLNACCAVLPSYRYDTTAYMACRAIRNMTITTGPHTYHNLHTVYRYALQRVSSAHALHCEGSQRSVRYAR